MNKIKSYHQEEIKRNHERLKRVYECIENNDHVALKTLLESVNQQFFNVHFDKQIYLALALKGRTEIVMLLQPFIADAHQTTNDYALQRAAEGNQLELIQQLAPFCNVTANGCRALIYALWNNNEEIVKTLAPYHIGVSMSTHEQSSLFHRAIEDCNLNILKTVLTFLNPKVLRSFPLQLANQLNKQDMVDVLYPLSDVDDAICDATFPPTNLVVRRKAEQEKEVLQQSVNQNSSEQPRKIGKKL